MSEENFRTRETGHNSLDQLFLERFITEVDRLKGKLDTNTETLYRLSRDVNDLRNVIDDIKKQIQEPVKAYGYGKFTLTAMTWLRPIVWSGIGALLAWWSGKHV